MYEAGLAILGIYLIIMLIACSFSIVSYVFSSLSMYQIAKRRGIPAYGLAWVPVANVWILGSIADKYQTLRTGKKSNLRFWLLFLDIGLVLSYIIFMITIYGRMIGTALEAALNDIEYVDPGFLVTDFLVPMLGFLAVFFVLSIALSVIYYICVYRVFHSCKPEYAVAFLLLSIFVSVTYPFLLFAYRKHDYIPNPYYVDGQPVYYEPGSNVR